MYVVSHTAIFWLCLQITLIHQFLGISVLKTPVDMVVNTLHYCLMFLLEEHLMITLVSSLKWNLFFQTCS